MAKEQKNGTWLKVFIGAILTLQMAVIGWVWNAAGVCKDVESNTEKIAIFTDKVVPKVETNHDDIIGIKKDIASILSAQERMEETEKENTKAIIDAIGRIKDGD